MIYLYNRPGKISFRYRSEIKQIAPGWVIAVLCSMYRNGIPGDRWWGAVSKWIICLCKYSYIQMLCVGICPFQKIISLGGIILWTIFVYLKNHFWEEKYDMQLHEFQKFWHTFQQYRFNNNTLRKMFWIFSLWRRFINLIETTREETDGERLRKFL